MLLRKIAVSGIGGVGGYYGAMLTDYIQREGLGREIHFVARGKHLEVIQAEGLELTTPTRQMRVRPHSATDKPEDIGPVELIIIATKSYDLEANLRQLRPLIAPHTIILPLLNGADISEQIEALLPNNPVWRGCTYISARKGEAGKVYLENDKESLYFGAAQAKLSPAEEELLQLMTKAGINAHRPDDIGLVIRKKFIMISATATGTSYYDSPIGQALSEHPLEMRALVEEVCKLSLAQGFVLGGDAVESAIQRQGIMPRESTSSMHVDFMNGNKTELEELTGYVVKSADALNIPVPTYRMMYEVLKLKENKVK